MDAHWNPEFFRHTVINTQMYFASLPGAGVPGWDPFLGGDILGLLRDAAARYPVEVAAEHAAMLAEHTALSANWAGRLRAGPTPTLEDARRRRAERLSPPHSDRVGVVPGTWRPWEIEEIRKEQTRADGIERAWERAENAYKAINPTWGGGT